MTGKSAVEAFIGSKSIALVGASAGKKKFGNTAAEELRKKGYQIHLVHPSADTIDGARAYPSLAQLPEPVDGVLLVVPPQQTEKLVREAHEAGIQRVWMQQGAESEDAVKFCRESGMTAVHGECILMFAQPSGFHAFHRWIWGLVGKLPK